MDQQTANKATMARFYDEVFGQGRLETIDELAAPDMIDHEEAPPGVPEGIDGVKMFVQMFRAAFPDLTATPTVMLAEGDLVSAHVMVTGTHEGDFMGVPASGNSISMQFIDIVRFRDGKAVEHWGASDMTSLMQQIGGMPADA